MLVRNRSVSCRATSGPPSGPSGDVPLRQVVQIAEEVRDQHRERDVGAEHAVIAARARSGRRTRRGTRDGAAVTSRCRAADSMWALRKKTVPSARNSIVVSTTSTQAARSTSSTGPPRAMISSRCVFCSASSPLVDARTADRPWTRSSDTSRPWSPRRPRRSAARWCWRTPARRTAPRRPGSRRRRRGSAASPDHLHRCAAVSRWSGSRRHRR